MIFYIGKDRMFIVSSYDDRSVLEIYFYYEVFEVFSVLGEISDRVDFVFSFSKKVIRIIRMRILFVLWQLARVIC